MSTTDHRSPEAVDLLRRALELATQHPRVYDQGNWLNLRTSAKIVTSDEPGESDEPSELKFDPARPEACGTVGCIAGNALLLSGKFPLRTVPDKQGDVIYYELEVYDSASSSWRSVDTWTQPYAQQLLDLTYAEADALFAGDITLSEAWALAELFTAGEVTHELVTDVVRRRAEEILAEVTDGYEALDALEALEVDE